MKSPLLAFGGPPDAAAWAALMLALVALAAPRVLPPRIRVGIGRSWKMALAALAAAALLLSCAYVAYYLRGGPRIVDATSYFLEARTLAQGELAFDVPEPSASFRGRFLVSAPGSSALAVIFPPGYPAILALGFILGSPLLIGPALAAGLVIATYCLARVLFGRQDLALLAALLSVLSAALRYHTADTMSHGWAALLLCVVLACVWKTSSAKTRRSVLALVAASGFAAGWLVATRPITGGLGVVIAGAALLARRQPSGANDSAPSVSPAKLLLTFAATLAPGLVLLLLHQHAATGEWLSSSQLRYYALADGPPGCFRYGFGSGIGCVYEHGDVVHTRLVHGYGPIEAVLTTLRRLHHHSLDIANFEPFALALPFALFAGGRDHGVRLLAACVVGVVIAYAPFYFDGTYPGGGARLLADVLPLEHVLLAWSLTKLGAERLAAPLALAGFAFHGAYSHRALSEREGGRPMFEPKVLELAGVDRGLVFVDTDHGFNLGHSPGARDAFSRIVVARARGDSHDTLLWHSLGRPPSYRYTYQPFEPRSAGHVEAVTLAPARVLRFEAEASWPVIAISGGWSHPDFPAGGCASRGRALRLNPSGRGPVTATLELAAPESGSYDLELGWVLPGPVRELRGRLAETRWRVTPARNAGCWRAPGVRLELERGAHTVALSSSDGVLLDYLELQKAN